MSSDANDLDTSTAPSDSVVPGDATAPAPAPVTPGSGEAFSEFSLEQAKLALRKVKDPDLNLNIVDLGLIYNMEISPLAEGNRVDVKMTLTAQGCGMGGSIAADAMGKLLTIPGIKEADVQVVWEPAWTPEKISPEGRTLLGMG